MPGRMPQVVAAIPLFGLGDCIEQNNLRKMLHLADTIARTNTTPVPRLRSVGPGHSHACGAAVDTGSGRPQHHPATLRRISSP
ncbi:hypothetical protein QFZ24_009870 [Streptomyces phaeochromogenes]|nr:hypothetical protein [Streptomyces phaeochromogenes]